MKAAAAVWGRKGHLQAAADPTTTVFGTSVGGSLCVGAHTLRDISMRSQAPRMLVALQAQPAGHHQNWQLPDTRKNVHKVALTAAYRASCCLSVILTNGATGNATSWGRKLRPGAPWSSGARSVNSNAACAQVLGGPQGSHPPLNCTPTGGAVSSMTDRHSTNPNTTLKI